jgi:hypothetical protein
MKDQSAVLSYLLNFLSLCSQLMQFVSTVVLEKPSCPKPYPTWGAKIGLRTGFFSQNNVKCAGLQL